MQQRGLDRCSQLGVAANVEGIQRLLQPGDVELDQRWCPPQGRLQIPAVIGIGGDDGVVPKSGAHCGQPAQVLLEIHPDLDLDATETLVD
ncbi:MAG: hypothetical protein QF689_07535 [Candidatus Latescibacteria bacterium]|nr:hypothetical protein [Candidatus Latescibacterota bacterium]MDP7448417.1 hypothetical protein [Candidatus Latescibacterota bacterium]HJN30612.1 hypothetical protein [Candidatus Latescibacterota bacterium]